MMRARLLLLLACLSAGCHGPVLAQKTLGRRGVTAFFRDTALVTVSRSAAGDFDLSNPAERDSLRAMVRRERELWRAQAPKNYRFLLKVGCFCPGTRGWLLIEVRTGQPLKAWDRSGKAVSLTDWSTISIDQVFDNLEKTAERQGMATVGFDPGWHYPAYVYTSALRLPDSWGIFEARALRPEP